MVAVRYFVSDVDQSLEFYSRLGFTLAARWGPPFAMVEKDGVQVWLSGPGTSASKPMPNGDQPSPGGWNRVVVQVADLDLLYTELKGKNVAFRNEPIKGPGGTQVLAEDPDGNPVELFEPNQ